MSQRNQAAAVVVEDLIQGNHEWRNIQDIVRLTFKAFHDVLRAQGEAIKTLERAVDAKADKEEGRHATDDIAVQLTALSSALAGKADTGDVAAQMDKRALKADVHAAFQAQEELMNYAQKTNAADVGAIRDGHGRALATLRTEMREYATAADVAEVAARVDFKVGRQEVDRALERKVDASAIDALLADRVTKTELSAATAHAENAGRAALDAASDGVRAELAAAMDRLRADAGGAARDTLDRRSQEVEAMRDTLGREVVAVKEFGSHLRAELEDRAGRGRGEVERLAATQREMKEDLARLRESTATQSTALTRRLETMASDAEEMHGLGRGRRGAEDVEELWQEMERKADRSEVAACLSLVEVKADTTAVSAALLQKANVAAVKQALERVERGQEGYTTSEAMKHALERVERGQGGFASKEEVKQALDLVARGQGGFATKEALERVARGQGGFATNEALERLARGLGGYATKEALERLAQGLGGYATKEEVSRKSDMRDVCALVDVKVDIDDVNHALAEVSRELEAKCSVSALETSICEQGVINSSLCAECSVGRWIWKSGQVKPGNGVPWNVQSVNTDPSNFVWEKDKVTIVTMAPGLYEVTFGFFVRKKPAIQLLVNGEPVLAAVNSASYVLHHSSGRLTSVGRHPAGNVTGLTLIDFLALPPKARIAITYNGEDGGEGFIALKKL